MTLMTFDGHFIRVSSATDNIVIITAYFMLNCAVYTDTGASIARDPQ